MAGGQESRWNGFLNIHKHLIKIDGERLIDRMVRLVRERLENPDITMVAFYPEYDIDGVKRVQPIPLEQQTKLTSGANESANHWSETNRTIVLYGDVFYSNHAMDQICVHWSDNPTFFGRQKGSQITGCYWGEIFAFSFLPKNHADVLNAIHISKKAAESTNQKSAGWQIYRALHGLPLIVEANWNEKTDMAGDFVEIDDFTEDFDRPEDFTEWFKRLANHRMKKEGV